MSPRVQPWTVTVQGWVYDGEVEIGCAIAAAYPADFHYSPDTHRLYHNDTATDVEPGTLIVVSPHYAYPLWPGAWSMVQRRDI